MLSTNPLHAIEMASSDVEVWSPRDGPRRIEVSITVQSIENVNTVEEKVDVGLLADVYWLPTAEEKAEGGVNSCESWDFSGNMQTVNAIKDHERDIRKKPRLKEVGGVTKWFAQLWVSSTFKQQFDLHAFPFDCQDLIVRFEMGNVKQMVYCPPAHQSVFVSIERELCPLSDWDLCGATVLTTGTDPKLSKQGNSYSQLVLQIHLARHWKPHFFRVGLPIQLFIVMSAISYVMDPVEDFEARIGFIMTLLLTIVAFQINVQGLLPLSPYLSIGELYVLGCVLMIFFVAIESGVVKCAIVKFDVDFRIADDAFFVLHVLTCVFGQLAVGAYCWRVRSRQLGRFKDGQSLVTAPQDNIQVSATEKPPPDPSQFQMELGGDVPLRAQVFCSE